MLLHLVNIKRLTCMNSEIFIDGEAGTTGLVIRELLAERPDLSFISLDDSERKNEIARKKISTVDVTKSELKSKKQRQTTIERSYKSASQNFLEVSA